MLGIARFEDDINYFHFNQPRFFYRRARHTGCIISPEASTPSSASRLASRQARFAIMPANIISRQRRRLLNQQSIEAAAYAGLDGEAGASASFQAYSSLLPMQELGGRKSLTRRFTRDAAPLIWRLSPLKCSRRDVDVYHALLNHDMITILS